MIGCLENSPDDTRAVAATAMLQDRTTQSPTRTSSPRETSSSTDTATDQLTVSDSQAPAHGQSGADVTTEVVETDESVEYVEEDDAARYIAAGKHGNQEEIKEGGLC